jgi:hypothetical protein
MSSDSDVDLDNDIHFINTQTNDLLQTSLAKIKENHPFGYLILTPKLEGNVQIYFQNVNSIYKFKSWNTFQEACTTLKNYE